MDLRDRQLLHSIENCKISYYGHFMRNRRRHTRMHRLE